MRPIVVPHGNFSRAVKMAWWHGRSSRSAKTFRFYLDKYGDGFIFMSVKH